VRPGGDHSSPSERNLPPNSETRPLTLSHRAGFFELTAGVRDQPGNLRTHIRLSAWHSKRSVALFVALPTKAASYRQNVLLE
jgi:hypothetical protein